MARARSKLINVVKELCKKERGGSYHVHRGPINWAAFDFTKYPRAISILLDETAFMRDFNPAILTLEVMTTMPEGGEIDDTKIDEIHDDLESIFQKLLQSRDPDDATAPIVWRLVHNSDNAIEVSDVQLKVQGVIASVRLDY